MPDDAPGPLEENAEWDECALLGGLVRLRQPRQGYRAGLDAALLAAAVEAATGERVLEVGCGAGAALVQAAVRAPGAVFLGVERDPGALALARMNTELNGLGDRIHVRAGEVSRGFRALGLPRVDAAFANPPFFDDPSALRPPAPERRGAWMADDGLAAWCGYLLSGVVDAGRVTLVHRADRLADLLAGLARHKGGSFTVRPVHAFVDSPAKRVLVRAVRCGRAPLRLLPPLVLHVRGGGFTPEAGAILRGEAVLPW